MISYENTFENIMYQQDPRMKQIWNTFVVYLFNNVVGAFAPIQPHIFAQTLFIFCVVECSTRSFMHTES